MKHQSLSWIDRADLERALSRAGASTLASGARHFEASPFWPAVGLEKTAARAKPPPIPAESIHEKAAVRVYVPPEGPLEHRLRHYLGWVVERTGCRQIFVADADGLVLLELNADPDLVAISSMFVSVLNRVDASLSSPIRGSVAIDLEMGDSLHVVQAETGLGPYALGFAVPRPASREDVESARDGLVRVMSRMEDVDPEDEVRARRDGLPRTVEMSRGIAGRPQDPPRGPTT